MSLLADALIDSISAFISISSGVVGSSRPEALDAPALACAPNNDALTNGAQNNGPAGGLMAHDEAACSGAT